MFHAEVYMDRYTYFEKDHIFWRGLRQQMGVCSVWCIFDVLRQSFRADFEKEFSDWFYRGLALALGQGVVEIQKEIRRFGGFLENAMSKYGTEEMPKLYVCFQGQLYVYGEKEKTEYILTQNRGLYLGGIAEETARQSMKQVYEACKALSWEKTVYRLRRSMLAAICRKELERGYFLMWEDKEDDL